MCSRKECSSKQPHQNEENEGGIFLEQPFCRYCAASWKKLPPIFSGWSVISGVRKRVVSKRVVLADVPPERKSERGYVRQNHPFGNRPFISQWPFSVLTKGWFPKGWFWRMFPRNENRNEGTFAKTTLLGNRPFISQWLLTVEVFLLTVRLFYLRWGNRK